MNLLKLFIIQVWLGSHFLAGIPAYPGIPEESGLPEKDYLFKIERSRDADKIYYQINLTSEGRLHPGEPVIIFWKRYTRNGRKEPLTRMQQNRSYGLKYTKLTAHQADFHFAAFKEKTFTLKTTPDGGYNVITQTLHGERELVKMYVRFAGGTFLVPSIEYVEFHLKDISTGFVITEIFKP